MSKKYTADDYERMAQQYALKAKEEKEKELVSFGRLFIRIYGKCSLHDAESFLQMAIKNNQQYHWYKTPVKEATDGHSIS